MDYISKKIEDKSYLCIFTKNYREAATQEQSRLEYLLVLTLGYLWNKNFAKLESDIKDKCLRQISHPSIGTIIDICRTLDINNESLNNNKLKKFRESVNSYPALRNEKIGHGFSFDDDSEALYRKFAALYEALAKSPPDFLRSDIEIIKIIEVSDTIQKAILYKPTGDYTPITIPRRKVTLEAEQIYIKIKQEFHKVSPFLKIADIEEFFIYSFIEDRLAARSVYNKLISTERRYFETPELTQEAIEQEDSRRRAPNGTIVNNYENNYKKYIDTAIVRKLVRFLKNNESTVFATLWGHGGVGKTAAIQRVCETLLLEENKLFDYIIFVSAKDRYFNFYSGEIEQLADSVDSLESVLRFINKTVFNTDSSDDHEIVHFKGKALIVLDDYETLPSDEKAKIIDLIKKLSIAHHKVVITTRSASQITGEEIQVEELTPKETLDFFDSVLINELELDPANYKRGIAPEKLEKSLHEMTSGRPLFIFQAAIIYGESNSIHESIHLNLENQESAINFLYGRILNYLSADAKKIFTAMGLLIKDNDLSNVLSKLKYILNMENESHRFELAIEELTKLKIIKIIDDKFFKVYSTEIANIMRSAFTDEGDAGGIKHRLLLVGSDKKLDTDLSLLDDADNSRITRKPEDVINKYRHIISRNATPDDIKIKAVINLVRYLIDDEGDFERGTAALEEHYHIYSNSPNFVKAYAAYMWRGDEKDKQNAISALRKILGQHVDIEQSENIVLLSTLMGYETNILTSQREELKNALTLGEITKRDYEKKFSEQRDSFFRIYKHPGEQLLKTIREDKLEHFNNETKINCIRGLISLLEVCLRRQMFDEIDEILEYTFNNLKYNYHDSLKRKLERINRVRKTNKRNYDDYILSGSIGDRFNIATKPHSPLPENIGSLGKLLATALEQNGHEESETI
jgi:hypothetical protein